MDDIESAFARAAPVEGDATQRLALALVKAALLGGTPPPVTIGRYHVLSLVGRGAMGIVYAAWDPQLERRIALKVVAPSRDRDPANEQARLVREGQALARLGHPNVIAVHDAGIHDDAVYLAMEYIEGPTLAQWLAARARRRDEILRVVIAAGRGLAAAHTAGIVHRDFKPDNVLIGELERVRVVDFGLARATGEGGDLPATPPFTHGTTSICGGTPAYAAPEQLAGERVAAPADQYAFCVVLHEALTGRRPQSAADVDPALPRRLRRAIQRGLAQDPSLRFAHLDDLLAAILRRARRHVLALAAIASTGIAVIAAAPAAHVCEGDPGAMAEIWTTDRRASAQSLFAAGDPGRGPAVWARTAAILDEYAARWEDARTASCAAGALAHDERALRLACLADRRDHVDALVQVFGEPEPAVIRYAVTAARALPSIDACRRVASLGRTPAARLEAPSAEFSRRLARAAALRRAGRYADAATLASGLVDEAGNPTHLAAALQLAAEIETDRQDYPRAEVLARKAVAAAASADDARLEFGSWLLLVYGVGWGQGRADEGLAFGEAARAALLRLGDDAQLRSELLGTLGAVEHQRGRHLEAIALAEEAIALRESDAEGATRSGPLWQALGIAQLRLDREQDALVSHDAALARLTALLGPTHPDTAQTMASRAQVLRSLGRTEEARAGYEDAIAALEAAFGPEHRALAIPLLNLGNLERAQGNTVGAATIHARYRAIVASRFPADHHEHGRAQVILAEEQLAAGDAEAALASAIAAVAIARRHFSEPHVRLSYALAVHGAALLRLGRADEAVVADEEALALAERALAADDPDLADYLLDGADALAAAGRLADARAQRLRARDHLRRITAASSGFRPRTHELLERAANAL